MTSLDPSRGPEQLHKDGMAQQGLWHAEKELSYTYASTVVDSTTSYLPSIHTCRNCSPGSLEAGPANCSSGSSGGSCFSVNSTCPMDITYKVPESQHLFLPRILQFKECFECFDTLAFN